MNHLKRSSDILPTTRPVKKQRTEFIPRVKKVLGDIIDLTTDSVSELRSFVTFGRSVSQPELSVDTGSTHTSISDDAHGLWTPQRPTSSHTTPSPVRPLDHSLPFSFSTSTPRISRATAGNSRIVFRDPVNGSSRPTPRQTRRVRSLHPMDPSSASPQPFPPLPPSPAPSSSFSSSNDVPRRVRSRPNITERPHIFEDKFKKNLKEDRQRTKDELLQQILRAKKKTGYNGNLEELDSLMSYQAMLESAKREDSAANSIYARPFASSSMINLSGQTQPPPVRPRHHSLTEASPEFLESYLKKYKSTIDSPKPVVFTPTIEQTRLRQREKDEEINRRLHGPKRESLPKTLPPSEDAQVSSVLKNRSFISKYAREQVAHGDIERLKPAQWLNDEIINFYGALIFGRSEGASKENVPNGVNGASHLKTLNAWYFSTFFWSKLEKDGYEKGRLFKWTKKMDIFTKDVVLVPVNHNNMHWTAAAINFRRKRVESYDSMNMDRRMVFQRLRQYLDAEHRYKKQKPFDFTGWVDYVMKDTPQQENGYDCGVFTCQFLESLSRGEETFNFKQENIPFLRRRMIWEIANGKLWIS